MQASTLGILEDADFSPKQARALAQAIEGEVKGSEVLTVPTFEARLDSRLDSLKAELRLAIAGVRLESSQMENRLFGKMVGLALTMAGLTVTAVYFLVLNLKR
jgi:hypothetical protein